MANQWFRLWHDMPNDPKWRTIARASKQPIAVVMSVYLHVLVIASNATERGRTHGMNCEDVASALDVDKEDVEAIIEAMQGRVLDGDKVTGWSKRQPVREDGSAARARDWRESRKEKENAVSGMKSDSERNRTQPNAPDKDKDTEKTNPMSASPVGFADFWSAYPRKVGKGAAEKSWKKLRPDLQTVLQAIKRAAVSPQWAKDGGQYIPNPATWLNQKRWEDESAPAMQVSTKDSRPWFMSAAGIEREAARIGVKKLDGEMFPYFKARVFAAAGITDDMLRNVGA